MRNINAQQVQDQDTSSGFRQCRYEFKIPSSPIQVQDSVSADTSSRFRSTRSSSDVKDTDHVEIAKTDGDVQERLKKVDVRLIGSGDEAKHSDNRPKSDAFKIESRNYFYQGNPSLGVQQRFELVNKFVKE